jgi:hypothetical protein
MSYGSLAGELGIIAMSQNHVVELTTMSKEITGRTPLYLRAETAAF